VDSWTPTPENLEALPEPVRRYLEDLRAGRIPEEESRTVSNSRQTVRQLQRAIEDGTVRVRVQGGIAGPMDVRAVIEEGLERASVPLRAIELHAPPAPKVDRTWLYEAVLRTVAGCPRCPSCRAAARDVVPEEPGS
jgi:hypothetical protein